MLVAPVVVGAALMAAVSLSAFPPKITRFFAQSVGATRAELIVDYEEFGSATEVKFDYGVEGNKLENIKYCNVPECEVLPSNRGVGSNSVSVGLKQLKANTKYVAQVTLKNGNGETASAITHFTTTSAGPPVFEPSASLCPKGEYLTPAAESICGEAGATTLTYGFDIYANGAETQWQAKYISIKALKEAEENKKEPVWNQASEGSITPAEEEVRFKGSLSGLTPEESYLLKVEAHNGQEKTATVGFVTEAKPIAFEVESSNTKAESGCSGAKCQCVDLAGRLNPREQETQWHFEYATPTEAASAKWEEGPGGVIPASVGDDTIHVVKATLCGLKADTIYYARLFAENPYGISRTEGKLAGHRYGGFETAGPPTVTTFATHAIHNESVHPIGSTSLSVETGATTHYDFEYVTKEQFEESGFAGAQRTAEQDTTELEAKNGKTESQEVEVNEHQVALVVLPLSVTVGQDIQGLQSGQAYVYRLTAANKDGTVQGPAQTLVVPSVSQSGQETCSNEALRTGPSAMLPSCRAYEQVTPVDKHGAVDMFTWSPGGDQDKAWASEDGEHVFFFSPFNKSGENTGVFEGGSFFSQGSNGHWQTTSATPQPETGFNEYQFLSQALFNGNLTLTGFRQEWVTETGHSPEQVLKYGAPGGPYTSLPPFKSDGGIAIGNNWAGASGDWHLLVLQTVDRTWCTGHPTGTSSGEDLYEWSDGECHQLNVDSKDKTIGTCGALLARGDQGKAENDSGVHAISANGSRVFFNADPEPECPTQEELNPGGPRWNLYMRTEGATKDIGAYGYLGADSEGKELLLEKKAGAGFEFYLYETGSGTLKHLLSTVGPVVGPLPAGVFVSEDLGSFYLGSLESLTTEAPTLGTSAETFDLYRYDVAREKLSFALVMAQNISGNTTNFAGPFMSPDGRFFYWKSAGNPGVPHPEKRLNEAGEVVQDGGSKQLYRYDSIENSVECVSCASLSDPEPLLEAVTEEADLQTGDNSVDGVPRIRIASDDGGRVFFETAATLVPQDINGEVPLESKQCTDCLYPGGSPSFDVYEWRAPGLDGCGLIQGCIALVSGGREGVRNKLVGVSASGRDVFFATHESLVVQDGDGAGDIYDARIGGGEPPPPPPPIECEGDACAHPMTAPIDTTPASLSFTGPGNAAASVKPSFVAKPKPKAKRCHGGMVRKNGRCVRRRVRKGHSTPTRRRHRRSHK